MPHIIITDEYGNKIVEEHEPGSGGRVHDPDVVHALDHEATIYVVNLGKLAEGLGLKPKKKHQGDE